MPRTFSRNCETWNGCGRYYPSSIFPSVPSPLLLPPRFFSRPRSSSGTRLLRGEGRGSSLRGLLSMWCRLILDFLVNCSSSCASWSNRWYKSAAQMRRDWKRVANSRAPLSLSLSLFFPRRGKITSPSELTLLQFFGINRRGQKALGDGNRMPTWREFICSSEPPAWMVLFIWFGHEKCPADPSTLPV